MRLAILLALAGCAHVGNRLPPYGTISWEDPHGVLVVEGDYPVNRERFAQAIDDTLRAWRAALPREDLAHVCDPDWPRKNFCWVVFEPFPFPDPACPPNGECRGLTRGRLIRVGFDPDEWPAILQHEASHLILYRAGIEGWDKEETLRDFHERFGTPY